MTAPGGRTLRRTDSIRDIDGHAWDRISGDNPLLSHAWLSVMEASWREPVRRRYFLLEESGRLVAAAACYVDASSAKAESVDDLLFGRLGSLLSIRPALVCGFPWNTGSGCVTDPALGAARGEELAALLVEAVTDEARRAGRAAAFLSVSEAERGLRTQLRARGYAGMRHEPVYVLDLCWPDFAAYRRSLPSKNIRKNVRREMNKCRKQGVEISELADPAGEEVEIHRLVDRHFRRYGWPAFPYAPGWFRELKQQLGENVSITTARRGERLVGLTVTLRRRGVRQMILTCVDHAAEGGNLTHFNLAYYHSVEDGLRLGDRRYVVGPGQHLSRRRRGYRPAESYLYCRLPGPAGRLLARAWLRLLESWLSGKRPGSRREEGRAANPG